MSEDRITPGPWVMGHPRWRPVLEKPPVARRVLLYDGEVYEGFWGGDGWNAVGGLEPVVHPTHWMDLDDLLNLERP